jgi:hypothetical protein
MSAYIVDKEHVLYLVEAAMSRRIGGGSFYWMWGNPTQSAKLGTCDYERAVEVANMLWRENIKSVSARYPNESSATLPGPKGGAFVITRADFEGVRWLQFDAVQVIKACDCFNYQSCEHGEWEASEAKGFVDALRSSAWHELPGYDGATWGAPAVYSNARNCVSLSELASRPRRA